MTQSHVPTLESARIILRRHVPDNEERVHAWYNDEEIQRLSTEAIREVPRDVSARRISRWVANEDESQLHLALHLRATDQFVGFLHLVAIDPEQGTCKVGMVLGARDLWGQGLGTEALARVVRHVFDDRGLARIAAEAYADNPRSWRMLERVGFVREGVLREALRRPHGRVDEYAYGLLRHEWAGAPRG